VSSFSSFSYNYKFQRAIIKKIGKNVFDVCRAEGIFCEALEPGNPAAYVVLPHCNSRS